MPRQVRRGWDRLRAERYRRQIEMGVIDARWPLSPREADSPAWDSLPDAARDRFDHLMAVYAAMIEAIDTSVGTLVEGLRGAWRTRRHADPVPLGQRRQRRIRSRRTCRG